MTGKYNGLRNELFSLLIPNNEQGLQIQKKVIKNTLTTHYWECNHPTESHQYIDELISIRSELIRILFEKEQFAIQITIPSEFELDEEEMKNQIVLTDDEKSYSEELIEYCIQKIAHKILHLVNRTHTTIEEQVIYEILEKANTEKRISYLECQLDLPILSVELVTYILKRYAYGHIYEDALLDALGRFYELKLS